MANRLGMKATSIVAMVGGLLVIALLAVALTGRIEGQVVDDATGAPIPGAFVVGVWRGYAPYFAHGSTGCYHIEFRTTDAEGRFTLSGNISPLHTDSDLSIGVYAPGYTVEQNQQGGQYRAKARTGDSNKQYSEIRIASTFDCVGENDPRILPMYRAFASEMNALATTKSQKESGIHAQYLVDAIELGQKEARNRQGQRMTKLYDEMGRAR